jgi:hypothetical protein
MKRNRKQKKLQREEAYLEIIVRVFLLGLNHFLTLGCISVGLTQDVLTPTTSSFQHSGLVLFCFTPCFLVGCLIWKNTHNLRL